MTFSIGNLYLAIILYSFIGWFYEAFIWAPCEKREFLDRGFLIGPICPIYGLVANLDFYALSWCKNPIGIFFLAIAICCALEYLTSWVFEKAFGQRWWDYSNYAFNLNGRISVYSGFFFGVAGLLLVKVLHPAVINLFGLLSPSAKTILISVIAVIHALDCLICVVAMRHLCAPIEKLYDKLMALKQKPIAALNSHKSAIGKTVPAKALKAVLNALSAFNAKMIEFQSKLTKKKASEESKESV